MIQNKIFLPGTGGQISFFLDSFDAAGKRILLIGENADEIALLLIANSAAKIDYVLEFNHALAESRLKLAPEERIRIRMMEYGALDFNKAEFDAVYVQAAISRDERKAMLKEIHRVLIPGGILCSGEITALKRPLPPFVANVFERSLINPIAENLLVDYYRQHGFKLIEKKTLNKQLIDFYRNGAAELNKSKKSADEETAFVRKSMKQYIHEVNVFLKQGGEKYAGFTAAIFQKESN